MLNVLKLVDTSFFIIGFLLLINKYNINPIIKGKGSAIFIHVAKRKYEKTEGCVGLKKIHLLKLLSLINKNTQIKIT